MGGCASKPKEFDNTRPEALPSESTSPKKVDDTSVEETNIKTDTNTTTNESEPPLVDLSKPKEGEGETSNATLEAAAAAPAVVPAQVPAAAPEEPKEETAPVSDQVEVAAKQLAEINLVEAVKVEGQEIKPKAKEEEPAAAASAEIEPKATKEKEPKAAAPTSEDKAKDAPLVTV